MLISRFLPYFGYSVSPRGLMTDESSMFYKLCEAAGSEELAKLKQLAGG